MTAKSKARKRKLTNTDKINLLGDRIDKLTSAVEGIKASVDNNIGQQAVAAVEEKVVEHLEQEQSTIIKNTDPVIDAIKGAEVAVITKLGEKGVPHIHIDTDRRGFTSKTNVTGLVLDMLEQARQQRKQKHKF